MGLYPPIIPKEIKLDEYEYAYIVNDFRDRYIEALEREQLRRYSLIGLYYYFYVDEYFKIIDEIFNKHVWKFLK